MSNGLIDTDLDQPGSLERLDSPPKVAHGHLPVSLKLRCLFAAVDGNRCKCAPVPVQHGFFATELLPALADDIRVPRIDLDQSRPAFSALTSNQGGPGAGKWVQDNAAALAAVRHRPLHQLHGLGRWMLPIRHGPRDEPDVTLIPRAAPVVVRAFTPPIQDRFILALVV